MKIGITGLSNSGKTTIFNSLTGMGVETTVYPSSGGEPNLGVVKVPDQRLDRLAAIFNPKKTAYSAVQYVDYIGLTKGDAKQNRSVFAFMKDADALVLVVRAFKDEAVMHPMGGVDPMRDLRTLDAELILADMELVERRLQNIALNEKKGKKPAEAERTALTRCMAALEAETPIRELELAIAEAEALQHLQFLSIKPVVIVMNVGEDDLRTGGAAELSARALALYAGKRGISVLALSGRIEMEIAELPADEARAFLDDLGIDEPALTRLIRASYENLGLISFFTVGPDECRAWALRMGSHAQAAAGKIHSDIERGFIRAEVISYDDFIACGSMAVARDKGLLRLEGKTYVIRDGDIITFRFNV